MNPSKQNPDWVIIILSLFCFLGLSLTAFLAYNNFQLKKMVLEAVQSPPPFLQPIVYNPTPTPTVNTGKFNDGIISFNYPPEWNLIPTKSFGSSSETEFTLCSTAFFTVREIANYNQISGKPFISLDEYLGKNNSNSVNTILGGQTAKKIKNNSAQEVIVFTPDDKSIVDLYFSLPCKQPSLEVAIQKLFDPLLKTFRFEFASPTPNPNQKVNIQNQ